MFKKVAKTNQSSAIAAVTQHSSGLRYLELSGYMGNFRIARHVFIPIPRTVNADSAASLLNREVGIFNTPVVFGLPMRESMVRVIEYPRMPIEEAKQALQFDFDRHFTWSYSECTVDACEVDPPHSQSRDNMSMLVAASRNEHISKIVQIAERANIELKAIEPMNVALLRAVTGPISRSEAWHSLYSDAEGLHFAFVDKSNGLFYRSSPMGISGIIDVKNEEEVLKAVTEIQRTISYVSSQFKGVSADSLVLSGAIAQNSELIQIIQNSVDLKVETVNVYEQCGISASESADIGIGFESALGLCMF